MASLSVLPGQPLHQPNAASVIASLAPGKGAFERNGTIYASSIGTANKEGGVVGVKGKEDSASIPETGDIVRRSSNQMMLFMLILGLTQVLGTVTRLSRLQATLNIISVQGKACQQDWQGIIRLNDIRSFGEVYTSHLHRQFAEYS